MELPLAGLRLEFDTILVLLERPVVQRQLLDLILIIAIGWVLSVAVHRGVVRRMNRTRVRLATERSDQFYRLMVLFDLVTFAMVVLILLQINIAVFDRQGLPAGLLRSAIPLFWAILAYDFFLSILYVRYDEAAIRPYHYRVILPLFIGILASMVVGNFINLDLLAQLRLVSLFGAEVTLGVVVRAAVIVYAFGTAAYLIQDALGRVMARSGQDNATISSVLIISRYAVLGIGLLVLASALGVNTATLAVIGGGLSIGIGFGLQQIVANFISGILLLFEQSLRPGDVIDINGKIGTVEKLNIRATTIVTNDNVQIIVPNQSFLTNEVTSYTRTDRLVRIALPYGVGYGSDVKLVRDLVLHAVAQHGLVKESPPPQVHFLGFGESSLDFRVLVWMDQPRQMPRFRSDLYFMLWETFTKNNIEIPFPQRDLHLRTGWEKGEQVVLGDEETG